MKILINGTELTGEVLVVGENATVNIDNKVDATGSFDEFYRF